MDMTYAEAAEVLRRDDVSPSARAEAVEVALRALEDVEAQAVLIMRQNRELKNMRKAMNGQSEYAYLGGDLISRAALTGRIDLIDWHSTKAGGVLHRGAADPKSAYVRFAEVCAAVEGALAVEAEPVVHARWKLRGGLFRCTHCDAKALWSMNGGTHLYSREYEQVEAQRCHVCGAHMDEEVTE